MNRNIENKLVFTAIRRKRVDRNINPVMRVDSEFFNLVQAIKDETGLNGITITEMFTDFLTNNIVIEGGAGDD